MQDDSGAIHLTWFRWSALFVGQIIHRVTDGDCTRLANAPDVAVTSDPGVDDWVPSITQAVDGTLRIYFVSAQRTPSAGRNRLYVSSKRPGDPAWGPAVPVAGIASAAEHDHLPTAMRTGTTINMVWVRSNGTSRTPWLAPLPKSDIWYASSADGLIWSAPVKITTESAPVVHLFPAIYRRFDGTWWVNWLSTRLDPVNQVPSLFEFPLANVSPTNAYPGGVERNTLLATALPGYSHRITMTPAPGVYLGAWVDGTGTALDISIRFFTR
jgi:hypothetical protein